MAKREVIRFPGWRYGANGGAAIFQREEDVPTGWRDFPFDLSGGPLDRDLDGSAGGSVSQENAEAILASDPPPPVRRRVSKRAKRRAKKHR